MGGNEAEAKDKVIIAFFETQLARRKALPQKELWLADLKDIYGALMPHLPVSEPARKYIQRIINDAQ
jgi:hypothetical protein